VAGVTGVTGVTEPPQRRRPTLLHSPRVPTTQGASTMGPFIGVVFLLAIAFVVIVRLLMRSIPQAHVAVVTVFGKYSRLMREGLNFKLPWEKVSDKLSLQNRALKMDFQAITQDQANVKFSTMVLYSVSDAHEESVKKAVFSFASPQEFQLALQRTVDGSIRQFVATTKQSDILGMRQEIVEHTKKNLDGVVSNWGWVVSDIQITDMVFDKEVMDSMARVVSSKNLLAAAANEGAALLVKRTKDAEAEAAYKTIGAEAEKKAAALRGEGLALFRRNIALGMKEAAENLREAGVDANFLLFLEYTDALKYTADHAQGKVIFMDNGAAAPVRVAQAIGAMGEAVSPPAAPR
jgi:regulator of protease activity HflC (stomatin/prohibitin superfamily)